jgi:hypothetical protein
VIYQKPLSYSLPGNPQSLTTKNTKITKVFSRVDRGAGSYEGRIGVGDYFPQENDL